MGSSEARWVLGLALGLTIGVAGGWFLRGAGGARREAPAALSIEAGSRASGRSGGETPAPTDSEPEARAARSVAPEGEAMPVAAIRAERAEALSASIAPPRVDRESGELALWGRVTDGAGAGVAGVLVRATRSDPYSRANASSSVGRDAPANASLDATLRDAARRCAELLARTFETHSDAQGAYRFDRLPPGRYLVEGYLRDALVETANRAPREVPAGVELDLVARPVFTVPVSVRLADGSAPEISMLVCKPRADERPASNWKWTPAEPELRLVEGSYEVYALANLIENGGFGELTGELRSEPQQLVLAPGSPIPRLELELAGRTGVRGRVTFAKDGITGGRAGILLLGLARDEPLDPERLATSRKVLWLRGDDEYAFLDLDPGRYALGVVRTDGAPTCAAREIEIAGGIVRCDFEVPPLDLSQFLTVRLRGTAGDAIEGRSFQFMHRQDGSSRGSGVLPMRGEDGCYVLAIPSESLAAYFGGTEGHAFELSVETKAYGSRTFVLAPGQTELDASFAPPATLDAVVAGIASPEDARRLRLTLTRMPVGESRLSSRSDEVEVRADGTAHFDEHEAGNYELGLEILPPGEADWSRRVTLLFQPVELAAGSNAARVTIPVLYSLAVRWTGSQRAERLSLFPTGVELNDWILRRETRWANPDENGFARFEDVPAGTYVLSGRTGASGAIEKRIEVPCGEVSIGP